MRPDTGYGSPRGKREGPKASDEDSSVRTFSDEENWRVSEGSGEDWRVTLTNLGSRVSEQEV